MMIDDAKLMAYLDGELSRDEAARIAETVEHDPALRARLDIQRSLKDRITAHFAPIAEEPVPDRFKALLGAERDGGDGGETAEIVDFADAKQDRDTRRERMGAWRLPQLGAIAASLAIGMLAGPALFGGAGGSSPSIAQGLALASDDPLAGALDTQLASTQGADSPIRVGITFRNPEGQYCRTFDGPEIDGLACRENGAWQVAMAVSDTEPAMDSQFRQAGSGNRIVLEYAQTVMAGDPVDAEGEARARDSGWTH